MAIDFQRTLEMMCAASMWQGQAASSLGDVVNAA
jgi:hypothetical protein